MGKTLVVRPGSQGLPEVFGAGAGFVLAAAIFVLSVTIAFVEDFSSEWSLDAHMPEADQIRAFVEHTLHI